MTIDVLTLLTADHNRVRGLFTRFEGAKDDPAQAAPIATAILRELDVHTRIEEDHLYPWASGLSEQMREMVEEGLEEHHVVDVLAEEIGQLDPSDEAWTAKLTVLVENVQHHAEEEEKELFPAIRRASTADDRASMAEKLEQAKAQLGAPVVADKIDLTTTELKQLASEQEIPGRSGMDHDELAATVAPPAG
jgi:hemerythrin superfamily protein